MPEGEGCGLDRGLRAGVAAPATRNRGRLCHRSEPAAAHARERRFGTWAAPARGAGPTAVVMTSSASPVGPGVSPRARGPVTRSASAPPPPDLALDRAVKAALRRSRARAWANRIVGASSRASFSQRDSRPGSTSRRRSPPAPRIPARPHGGIAEPAAFGPAPAMNSKASIPSSTSVSRSARIPGVSIGQPPARSAMQAARRRGVRPRASSSRYRPSSSARRSGRWSRRLPTPDDPANATVSPGRGPPPSRADRARI